MVKQCEHCGSAVSETFARVFAVDGDVYACPECSAQDAIAATAQERI